MPAQSLFLLNFLKEVKHVSGRGSGRSLCGCRNFQVSGAAVSKAVDARGVEAAEIPAALGAVVQIGFRAINARAALL
jgi:hypothetical protein